jgi:hypothetical protein
MAMGALHTVVLMGHTTVVAAGGQAVVAAQGVISALKLPLPGPGDGALLAEAPERFPLEQHTFVSELLLAAAAVDRTSSDWLVAGLAAVVRRPLRSRVFGEPCPQEVALAAKAQQLHDRLPAGHPAKRLYAKIHDRAHEAIARDEEADRSQVEE